MTEDRKRQRSKSRRRWLAVLVLGAGGLLPGFFLFTLVLSEPALATPTDWVLYSTLFFGSLVLVVVGLLGYAGAGGIARPRREQDGPGAGSPTA